MLRVLTHHRIHTDVPGRRTLIIGQIIVGVVWWLSHPLCSWADSLLPLPRASSSTERQFREEALYLKEETVSIASRYEQPISRAPPTSTS